MMTALLPSYVGQDFVTLNNFDEVLQGDTLMGMTAADLQRDMEAGFFNFEFPVEAVRLPEGVELTGELEGLRYLLLLEDVFMLDGYWLVFPFANTALDTHADIEAMQPGMMAQNSAQFATVLELLLMDRLAE